MKSFLVHLRYDLRQGIARQSLRFLPIFLLFFFLTLRSCLTLQRIAPLLELEESRASIADCYYLHFGGMVYELTYRFSYFNYFWIITYLLIAVFVAFYPFRDLQGFGKQLILRSRSVTGWWLGKCVWLCAAILVCYTAACLAIGAGCALFGVLSFEIHYESIRVLGKVLIQKEFTQGELLQSALLLPLSLISVYLIELLVSLLSKPVFGLLSFALILFVTLFCDLPWLPFQGMMFARSEAVVENGADPVFCAVACSAISLAVIAAGIFWVRRKDLI